MLNLLNQTKRPGTMLLDGATGTNLYLRGLPKGVCVEQWIAEHPQAIIELQDAFISAGSDAVYAPTFGANRLKLSHFGLEEQVESLNKRLVGITKEAIAGRKVFIGGDIAPTGSFLIPYGDKTVDEMIAVYREQAKALTEAGVDFFSLETMMSLGELRAAVLACREFDKPILATITVDEHGRTITGATLESTIVILQELGVSFCGLNCSCPPEFLLPIVQRAAKYAKIPLAVKPNAGKPDPANPGHYDITPEEFAADMEQIVKAGAAVIGGCCGSTPAHIAALRAMLDTAELPRNACNQGLILADEGKIYALDLEDCAFSERFACDEDLEDNLMDAEDEGIDCVQIALESCEDAERFAEAITQVHLPVCLCCEDEETLIRALTLYTGRAIVKTGLTFDVSRYGAVRME